MKIYNVHFIISPTTIVKEQIVAYFYYSGSYSKSIHYFYHTLISFLSHLYNKLSFLWPRWHRSWWSVFVRGCEVGTRCSWRTVKMTSKETIWGVRMFGSKRVCYWKSFLLKKWWNDEWHGSWILASTGYLIKIGKKHLHGFGLKYEFIKIKRYKNNCHIYPFAIISIHTFHIILKVHRGS